MTDSYNPVVEPIDEPLLRHASEYIASTYGVFPDTVHNPKTPFASSGIPTDMLDTFVSQSLSLRQLEAFRVVLGLPTEMDEDTLIDAYDSSIPRLLDPDDSSYTPADDQHLFIIERTSIPLYHCGAMTFKTYVSEYSHLVYEPVDDVDDPLFEVTGFDPVDEQDEDTKMGFAAVAYVEAETLDEAIKRTGYRRESTQ